MVYTASLTFLLCALNTPIFTELVQLLSVCVFTSHSTARKAITKGEIQQKRTPLIENSRHSPKKTPAHPSHRAQAMPSQVQRAHVEALGRGQGLVTLFITTAVICTKSKITHFQENLPAFSRKACQTQWWARHRLFSKCSWMQLLVALIQVTDPVQVMSGKDWGGGREKDFWILNWNGYFFR